MKIHWIDFDRLRDGFTPVSENGPRTLVIFVCSSIIFSKDSVLFSDCSSCVFALHCNEPPISAQLLAFLRVFCMTEGQSVCFQSFWSD